MQVRYQLRHRPSSPLAATLRAYYIPESATNRFGYSACVAGAAIGMSGQSFQSRSSP